MSRKKRNRTNRPQRSAPLSTTGAAQPSSMLRLGAGYGKWRAAAGAVLVICGLLLYVSCSARKA
jgi:hypothetical protein